MNKVCQYLPDACRSTSVLPESLPPWSRVVPDVSVLTWYSFGFIERYSLTSAARGKAGYCLVSTFSIETLVHFLMREMVYDVPLIHIKWYASFVT